MKKTIIFGPPGTGKTTMLLNLMEKKLKDCNPGEIGFVSFTRKAIEEAITRAATRFDLPRSRFRYFQTLHALAYRHTTIKKPMVSRTHIKQINELADLKLTGTLNKEYSLNTHDDKLLFLINYAKLCKLTLADAWHQYGEDQPWYELERLNVFYRQYKTEHGLTDFTDMLQNFVDGDRIQMPLKHLIVDEAQDINPLQWDVINIVAETCKDLVIAGDDDQAIYGWNGADVSPLLFANPRDKIVLPKSYRLHRSVFELANKISSNIEFREDKDWTSSGKKIGGITVHNELEELDLSNGEEWLLLTRTNYQTEAIQEELRYLGMLYQTSDGSSIPADVKNAIQGYQDLRKGLTLTGKKAKAFITYASCQLEYSKDKVYSKNDFILINFGDHWWNILESIDYDEMLYYRDLLAKGFTLNDEPKITLQTIHKSKGGECDNVVVFSDISKRIYDSFQENPDSEHKVFYVAVTRSKRNLYLMQPQTGTYYPLLDIHFS
jgi:DNA helicase-2/ATP-dependent DNA helicase PcrA